MFPLRVPLVCKARWVDQVPDVATFALCDDLLSEAAARAYFGASLKRRAALATYSALSRVTLQCRKIRYHTSIA